MSLPLRSKRLEVPLDPIRCELSVDLEPSPPDLTMRLVVDDATALLLHSRRVFPSIEPAGFLFEVRDIHVVLTLRLLPEVAERVASTLRGSADPGRTAAMGDGASEWPLGELENWRLERWQVVDAGAELPPMRHRRDRTACENESAEARQAGRTTPPSSP